VVAKEANEDDLGQSSDALRRALIYCPVTA
jgi:hypothetical protein